MGPTIAVIVIGVLYPASFAAFVISFTRLRSDLHAGFDRLEARFDKMDDKFDGHFDRLEARFDKMDDKWTTSSTAISTDSTRASMS